MDEYGNLDLIGTVLLSQYGVLLVSECLNSHTAKGLTRGIVSNKTFDCLHLVELLGFLLLSLALVVDDFGLLFGLGVLFNFGLGKGWGVA